MICASGVAVDAASVGARPSTTLQRQHGHVPVDWLRHAGPVQCQGSHLFHQPTQNTETAAPQTTGRGGGGGRNICSFGEKGTDLAHHSPQTLQGILHEFVM